MTVTMGLERDFLRRNTMKVHRVLLLSMPGLSRSHGERLRSAGPSVLTGDIRCHGTCARPHPHGQVRLFCMGGSAQFRVNRPKARTSS
jgi:hypothetical protein